MKIFALYILAIINNKTTVIIIANMYNANIFIYSHYKETEALKN